MNALRHRWLLLSAAALTAAGAAAFVMTRQVDAAAAVPGVVALESAGFAYEFHLPTGTDSLFDRRTDPELRHNLRDLRPDVVRKMRSELELKLGVRSLEELRGEYADTIRRLRALGYL